MTSSAEPDGLAGRRVLITGGSRGLGEAAVRRFAAAGATVVAASRSRPDDPSLPASFVPADLSTAAGARALSEQVLRLLGGVDILVNNAGGGTRPPIRCTVPMMTGTPTSSSISCPRSGWTACWSPG